MPLEGCHPYETLRSAFRIPVLSFEDVRMFVLWPATLTRVSRGCFSRVEGEFM